MSRPSFDEQALDDAAAGPVCGVTSFMPRIWLARSAASSAETRQLDAACFAAASGMDLGFHDGDVRLQALRRFARLLPW